MAQAQAKSATPATPAEVGIIEELIATAQADGRPELLVHAQVLDRILKELRSEVATATALLDQKG